MNPITRSLRNSAVAAATTAALLAVTGPAALAAGPTADIDVVYDCTSIDVTSSLDISNVVLQFGDGDTQRFEDLPERRTGTFAGTGEDTGEVITIAWVKSGNNQSGDGPGYGERFEFDASGCDGDTDANSESETESEGDRSTDGGQRAADVETSGDSTQDSDVDGETSTNDTDDSTTPTVPGDGDVPTDGTAVGGDASAVDGATDDGPSGETRVLSAALERTDTAADTTAGTAASSADVRSAGTGDVRSAGLLPNTGADAAMALAAALLAMSLGGGLLHRSRAS